MQTFMATIQVNSTPSHQHQQQFHAPAPAQNNHYGYNGTPNPPWQAIPISYNRPYGPHFGPSQWQTPPMRHQQQGARPTPSEQSTQPSQQSQQRSKTPPRRGGGRQPKGSGGRPTERESSAKRETTGKEPGENPPPDMTRRNDEKQPGTNNSGTNQVNEDNESKDDDSKHDDKRKDQRDTPQRNMSQQLTIRAQTPPKQPKIRNPYQRPAMVPTPMQQPVRIYEPLPIGDNWGRPSAEVYGAYARSEIPIYQPHLHQPRQMYEPQIPFDYNEGYNYSQSLADHEMEMAATSRPAEDAMQDHL
jgi:hypothetical protein